jgi:hypothetical protein
MEVTPLKENAYKKDGEGITKMRLFRKKTVKSGDKSKELCEIHHLFRQRTGFHEETALT